MNDCVSILGGEFQLLRVTPELYNEAEEVSTKTAEKAYGSYFPCRY